MLLLFRFGYEYGGGDQGEVLPFALYLNNSSLFQQDIYIESAALVWPNERFFIISLINIVPEKYWYEWVLLLHAVFSMLIFTGMRKLASLFLKSRVFQWGAVFINLYFLYLFAPGANELYYNCLIASVAVIAVWAVYYFFKKKYLLAFVILIPCTWMHPLVGIQLATIFVLTHLFLSLRNGEEFFVLFRPLLVYALFGASYVLYLKIKTDLLQQNSSLTDEAFYHILFEFRNPHHFNPLVFPVKSYFFTGLLTLTALLSFRKENSMLYFIVGCLLLFTIGCLNAIWIKNISIASLQFFKVSIWLKFIGVIATLLLVEKYMLKKQIQYSSKIEFALLTVAIITVTSYYFTSEKFKTQFDSPKNYGFKKEVDICIKANLNTDVNALFVHPVNFQKFHFFSKRSSFVNFKVIARNKVYLEKWVDRLFVLYGITTKMEQKGFNLQAIANENFSNINFEKTQLLKEKGITHMITFKTHEIENLEVIAENEQYKIYKL